MSGSVIRYTKSHEWVRVDEDMQVAMGLTEHAQEEMGDVVFVELPVIGERVEQFTEMAVVESVKAVSDIYAPVSGKVLEVNGRLEEEPELVNRDPHGEGYLCVIEIEDRSELDQLMDPEQYREYLEEEEG